MRSMTGYGEAREKGKEVEVYVQIKTVNHRFLDIEISLPPGVSFKQERRIREYIQSKINRGKISVYVGIKGKNSPSLKVTVNEKLALRYHEVLCQLRAALDLKDKICLSHFLNLPEIIKIEEEESKEELENLIDKALSEALKEVLQMRKREGERHRRSIMECLRKIEKNLSDIERKIPLSKEKYQRKVRENLKELLKGEDKERMAKELALLVDRGDISEEKVRLYSHLDQFKRALKEKGPLGKKLRFILQELQREVNTIGAKSNYFDISYSVVQIKEEIEKIREQIQNIE